MAPPPAIPCCGPRARRTGAFTIVELLVATSVLTLLVVLVAQLFSGAVNVITLDRKRMDADEQARLLFDRMATDFARMVKRADVDYLLKQPANLQQGSGPNGFNDQIAFYSEVPGYAPATGTVSTVSLVAYRVNAKSDSPAYLKVERLGKGLGWNGSTAPGAQMAFLPVPLASPLSSPLPSPMPVPSPAPAWLQAGSATMDDPDHQYELMGPHVFRLEYYYLLKSQSASNPAILSAVPWDTRSGIDHQSVSGLQDVAAIGVAIAVLDPTSHALVNDNQLATLRDSLRDFNITTDSVSGTLEAQWETTLNGTTGVPLAARKGLRVYHRYFYLNLPQ